MSYKTSEAKKYQSDFTEYVKEEVKKQGWDLPVNNTQHFYVDCIFYFPRKGMDCNNYFKCLLDAITYSQCIWVDDDVVCERVNGIFYDSQNPRIEITIYPTNYIGVFSNTSQLAEFKEANCFGCTRYKRNCSLLNNAIDGRIQEDIQVGSSLSCKSKKELKEKKK